MRYAIMIEEAAENYSAYVPDVPGCVATGKTLQEVKQHMKEALEFHLEGMLLDGEPWPRPGSRCAYTDVDVAAVKERARREKVRSAAKTTVRGLDRKTNGQKKGR